MGRLHICESSWGLDASLSTDLCHKLCNIMLVVGHNQLHQSGASFPTVLVLGFAWDQFTGDKQLIFNRRICPSGPLGIMKMTSRYFDSVFFLVFLQPNGPLAALA